MSFRVLLLNTEKCSGCGNCLTACPANELIEQCSGSPLSRIFVVKNGKCIIQKACQHCTDAPCVEKCPEKLLVRNENNLVTLNIDYETLSGEELKKILEKCSKCEEKPCIEACPFKNLEIFPLKSGQIPIKCDQCQGDPKCVKACGLGALKYVDITSKHVDKERLAFFLLKSTEIAKEISDSD